MNSTVSYYSEERNHIYKSILRPTVLFGSGTWTMNKSEQKMLAVSESSYEKFTKEKVKNVWETRNC